MKKIFLLYMVLFTSICFAQSREQLIGRVVDINSGKGIEGVEVQMVSSGAIKITDAEGKFKFSSQKGFVIGEPNYSFVISKEGYIPVGSTNRRVVFGSGAIENLVMKKDLERFLWITVLDGKTGNVVSNASVDIKGRTKSTNSFGRVQFDFSGFQEKIFKVSVFKECYKSDLRKVPSKGEYYIKLIPDCEENFNGGNAFDENTAVDLIDRAKSLRNGSSQGQVKAVQFLAKKGYNFTSTNFNGISLKELNLEKMKMKQSSFVFSNLNNTHLDSCDLSETKLDFTTLHEAIITNTSLSNSRGVYVIGKNADFKNSDLSGAYFFGGDFTNADFSGANLTGTIFAFSNLKGAKFDGAKVVNTGFQGSILDDTSFRDVVVKNTRINGAVITNNSTPFSQEQLQGLCKEPSRGYLMESIVRQSMEYKFYLNQLILSPRYGLIRDKYNNIETRAYFQNFFTGGFDMCSMEFTTGNQTADGWGRLDVHTRVLSRANRLAWAGEIESNHRKLLEESLIEENNIINKQYAKAWKKQQLKELNETKKSIPEDFNLDMVLSLLLQKGLLKETDIPWKSMAYTSIYRSSYSKLKNHLTRYNADTTRRFKIPPLKRFENFDQDFVAPYKRMILRQKRILKNPTFYTPEQNIYYKNIIRENDSIKFKFKYKNQFHISHNNMSLGHPIWTEDFTRLFNRVTLVFPDYDQYASMKSPKKDSDDKIKLFRFEVRVNRIEVERKGKDLNVLLYVEAEKLQYREPEKLWKTAKRFQITDR